MADFLMKFVNFCYHGNKGGSKKNLNDSVKTQFGAKIWDLS